MNLQRLIQNDKWRLIEGKVGEEKIFLRYRHEVNESLDLSLFPKAIQVFWEYKPNDSGFPSAEINTQMGVFENRIVEALEKDMTGIITAITTSAGTRHWLFYVKDTDSFSEKLDGMPQEEAAYPIEIEAETD